MLGRWTKWLGTSALVGVTTWLAWLQVADRLPQWSLYAVLGGVAICALLALPIGESEDGTTLRLINKVRGRNNQAVAASDDASVTGNVFATGKATVHQHGLQVTLADIRRVSIDASHAEVLPAARAVAGDTAVDVIDQRIGVITDKVIEQINEKDPKLFVRWQDPRFLAALTSAQRSYAETGDESLADLQANLLTALASQRIRTRREIILRQAIDVAPRLTNEHVNALAVNMYLTSFKINEPYYEPDWLIRALDTLLSHYYGRLPTSALDYQYMSSTGVCYTDQLRAFASGPYEILHGRYANAMYPSFTIDDLGEILSDTNPSRAKFQEMLAAHVTSEDAIVSTDQETVVTREGARFRVAPEYAPRILARERDGAAQRLTPEEQKFREMVLQRTLTAEQFKDEVTKLKPKLAEFLNNIHRIGALTYPLHPVGFILARQEIDLRAPQLAAVIDAAFDDEP